MLFCYISCTVMNNLSWLPSSICSQMGITGDGLMTAQAVGAATVLPTTVPLIQHGGLERAVSASQLDGGDTLCSLTPWCRYTYSFYIFPENIPF